MSEQDEVFATLVDALQAEQRRLWLGGVRCLSEELFARHPELLAQTIRLAALREDSARAERAAVTAHQFNFADAMAGYSGLIARLLRQR